MWPALTFLALASLAALHFWWRRKFLQANIASQAELERARQAQQKAAGQIQAQQQTLFDSMAEGLVLLDENGRIKLANRAFLKVFDLQSDPRGKTILEELRLQEVQELVESLAKGGQVLGHQLRLFRPAERWLEVNGASIFNGGARPQGTLLVFHDLTRVRKLERTREEFVANVSHELRTPLSLIKGYVETLLEGAKDNPEVAQKFLETIDRNAERLRLLIEDLLTISELESGRLRLAPQSVALRSLVEKVLSDLRSRAEAKGMTLHNATPELDVRADANRLEQVFGNLIDNAIKYAAHPQGNITVGARALEQAYIEVFVRDDGPGIPPEALERLFERFYRVDKARSRDQGGTGLGLSIVKHIIQNHGGKVWAESKPGHGATFFLTLPKS